MAFNGNGAVQQQEELIEQEIFGNVVSFKAIQADQDTEQQEAAEQERLEAIANINGRVKFPNVSSLFTQIPVPLDFVLPGLVVGTTAALVSPGGTGKSFLALQLAALVAGGVDTLGISKLDAWKSIKTGSVLYLSLEDNSSMISNRAFSIAQNAGLNDGTADSVHKLNALGTGLSICDVTGNVVDIISNREWGFWFEEQCKKHRLVVIDTLRLSHTGNENDSGQMATLMANLSAWASKGAAILFLHHTNKNSMQEGTGDSQSAARGSSVLIDNARGAFYLQRMTLNECQSLADPKFSVTNTIGDEYRRNYVKFGISKANTSAPWPDVWLRVGAGGHLTVADVCPLSGAAGVDRNNRKAKKDMNNG